MVQSDQNNAQTMRSGRMSVRLTILVVRWRSDRVVYCRQREHRSVSSRVARDRTDWRRLVASESSDRCHFLSPKGFQISFRRQREYRLVSSLVARGGADWFNSSFVAGGRRDWCRLLLSSVARINVVYGSHSNVYHLLTSEGVPVRIICC